MTSPNDTQGEKPDSRDDPVTPPKRLRRRKRRPTSDPAPQAKAPESPSRPAPEPRSTEPAPSERPRRGRSRGSGRSDGPRDDRPRRGRGDRDRGDRDRPQSDRPQSDRPQSDRPRRDGPRRDRPERAASGRGRSDRGRSDRGRSDRGRSDRGRSDRGRSDRARPDRARSERELAERDRIEREEALAPRAAPPAPPPLPRDGAGFDAFDLPDGLLRGLAAAGYDEPTEIQARMIPIALAGRNVVARSRTGTGKTCAFAMPALARLQEVQEGRDPEDAPQGPVRVLVVTPTRELALQVAEETDNLSRYVPVRTTPVYGGTRLKSQFLRIPHSAVVVGTPGRLLDHLGRRTLDPSGIEVLVLDEVDRMYDLGFRDDVDRILAACSSRKQTILVSATLNEDVEMLVERHLRDHERIEIESATLTVDEVEQIFYVVEHNRKRELLMELIRTRDPDRTIVFTRTRFTADRVAYVLQQEGFDAHEIHSGLPQHRREQILQRFRNGKLALLVATDVAARGLDIRGVDHVINYDIPQAAEDYVHRVGRTARMGDAGWAVTLVTPDDGVYLTAIEKLINKEVRQERFEGFGLDRPVAPGTAAPAGEEGAAEEASPSPRGIPNWARPARRRR